MRPIIYLIIIAAAGYLGYNYYMERSGGGAGVSEESTPGTPAAASATTSTRGPAAATSGNPAPVFKSKIIIPDGPPGEKHLAKPGIFYVLERASTEHATGVAAVVPGEEVRLVTRKGNGTVKVSNGKYEFELKESQLTNDLDVAQAAERKFALTNPPPRER